MYNHEPPDYHCPFCAMQNDPASRGWRNNRMGLVFAEGTVFCIVPTHHWTTTKGNCLILPKVHYENLYDLDEAVGIDLLRASKLIALAMKRALNCDGISTRQHNEPSGNQDVWHYHLHVFPRYAGDGLYSAAKARYDEDERIRFTEQFRSTVAEIRAETNE